MTGDSSSSRSINTRHDKDAGYEDDSEAKKNNDKPRPMSTPQGQPDPAPDDKLSTNTYSPTESSVVSTRYSSDPLLSNSILVGSGRTQAAFVNKLYRMLEEQEYGNLITWSGVGDLFSVSNPTNFSKTVLPQYFKHNNWQSFVRQLNMYGFHKVNDLAHSNLINDIQTWEFSHPHFRKGGVDDLQYIKRKSTKPQALPRPSSPDCAHTQESSDYEEGQEEIRSHLINMEEQVLDVSKTCDMLYKEVTDLKSIMTMQQEILQELVDHIKGAPTSEPQGSGARHETVIREAESGSERLSRQNGSRAWSASILEKGSQFSRSSDSFSGATHNRLLARIDAPQLTSDSHSMPPIESSTHKSYSRSLTTPQSHSVDIEENEKNNTNGEDHDRGVRFMGFGKESHLLNPEIDHSGELGQKRRRGNDNHS